MKLTFKKKELKLSLVNFVQTINPENKIRNMLFVIGIPCVGKC